MVESTPKMPIEKKSILQASEFSPVSKVPLGHTLFLSRVWNATNK